MQAIRRIFDIRPGEGRKAALAFASLMLVIASYTVVKSVRDALFLAKFGITQLSFMAIGLALATGFIITIYLRGTAGMKRNRLIWGTNLVIIASLLGIRAGLLVPGLSSILPWVLYIWSSLFGVFIVMQFWLLANDLFDPREAKRLFGFVGAGAITGGVVGGFLSRSLAGPMGAANLLILAAAMLFVEAVLVSMVWSHRRQEDEPSPRKRARSGDDGDSEKDGGGLSALRENRSVRLLAGALLLSVLATTLLDWQFKGIVKAAFADNPDEMAGFFGALYGWLSVGSFFVQTFVTGAVLRRFGVGVGLLALPVSLLLGSALVLGHGVIPVISLLVAASSAKVAEGGLRFSLDKASMELMWLPVPPDIKERGKSFVDTVVDRFGTGLTGFLWLALAAFGLDDPGKIHLISLAIIAVLVVWVFVLLGARGAYRSSLRDILTRRSRAELDPETMNLMDAEARKLVSGGLEQEDPQQVLFTLYLLEKWDGPLPDMATLLAHPDENVRLETLGLLARAGTPKLRRAATGCLGDASARVREAAIIYLHQTSPGGRDLVLEQAVTTGGIPPEVMDVVQLGSPDRAVAAAGQIQAALTRGNAAERAALVRLLAGAPPEMGAALLAACLNDEEHAVARAALYAAGRAGAQGLAEQMCEKLERPALHLAAADALSMLGAAANPALIVLANDEQAATRARVRALQLLGKSGGPGEVSMLLGLLDHEEPDLAHRALRALNRLRSQGTVPALEGEEAAAVEAHLGRLMGRLYRDLLAMGKGSWPDLRKSAGPGADLLDQVMRGRVTRGMDQVFRLLALLQDPREIHDAFMGVRSPNKAIRASSIEFMDNLLDRPQAERLLPLLEEQGASTFADLARRQAGLEPEERDALLARLLKEADPVGAAAAEWILNGDKKRETDMGLTTIEKAMKLQRVDVLQRASMEDLMHIAQITEEVEVAESAPIYAVGDAPDALFVVVTGKVRLHRDEAEIAVLAEGESFGSWALVDEAPRVAAATAAEEATLLKVNREDFVELLADRVDIVQAVFKAMVERLRNLAELADSLDDGVE